MHIGQTKNYIHIQILDNGQGIAPEKLLFLGQRFMTQSRDVNGTGLGLEIVRRIVQLHNGEIAFSNRVPHGLQVTIQLPLMTSKSI